MMRPRFVLAILMRSRHYYPRTGTADWERVFFDYADAAEAWGKIPRKEDPEGDTHTLAIIFDNGGSVLLTNERK